MTYKEHKVNLTEGQKESLAKAYKNKSELTLRLKHNQLDGQFPLMITNTQINAINKAKRNGTGMDLNISKTQMYAQGKNGGFLGALGFFVGKNGFASSK